MQLVLGMDKSVFSVIEPLITVYSRQAQVAVQLATKEVLQVIPGLDMELVESYLAAKVENARNNLPAPPFPSGSGTALNNAGGQQVLTVVSEALLDDDSNAVVSAVIKQANEIDMQNIASLHTPFQVLKWQHVTTNDTSLFTDAMSELLVKQYAEPELNN